MVTAGVIELNPVSQKYYLPTEHAAALSRTVGANNVAVFAQYIGMLGRVEDDSVECFHKGGGVPSETYPRFHEAMAEERGRFVPSSLESRILPLVPGLTDQLTRGICVLDGGCGRGQIIARLAELYPHSSLTGVDRSREAITLAREQASNQRLNNAQFVAMDLGDFDDAGKAETFDFIMTFDALHDQAKPLRVL